MSERDFKFFLRRSLEQLRVVVKIPLGIGPGWEMVQLKVHLQLHQKLSLPVTSIGGSTGWKQVKMGD